MLHQNPRILSALQPVGGQWVHLQMEFIGGQRGEKVEGNRIRECIALQVSLFQPGSTLRQDHRHSWSIIITITRAYNSASTINIFSHSGEVGAKLAVSYASFHRITQLATLQPSAHGICCEDIARCVWCKWVVTPAHLESPLASHWGSLTHYQSCNCGHHKSIRWQHSGLESHPCSFILLVGLSLYLSLSSAQNPRYLHIVPGATFQLRGKICQRKFTLRWISVHMD